MSKFCMGCMEQYDDAEHVCPHCGYSEDTAPADALQLHPGEILQERYIVGKAIGCGGFGVTYLGWDALLEHKVAIKEYMPSEFSTRSANAKEITVFDGKRQEQFRSGLLKFHEEAKKLAQFQNDDGIVRIFDSFEENNTAYIVMELLEGETLADYLSHEQRIPWEDAITIILRVATALKEVHAAGIIHRDIAPDNIFLTTDSKVKLIDFGAARFATTSHSRSLSVLIKQGYSPEEQYRSRGDQGPYTDIYALGAVLYRMITGETSPDALERRAYYENKKKDILQPISKFVKNMPENKQNAIYNAMNIQIEDRTQTAEDFIRELTTDEPVERKKGRIKAIDFFRWPLWLKITIPTAVSLIIVFSVLLATGVIFPRKENPIVIPDGMSRVPSVISSDLDTADERLTDATLLYSIAGKEYSSLIGENLILAQSVDGGSVVEQNSVIDLVISGGAERADLPDIVGLSQAEATALLEDAGFTVGIEQAYSKSVGAGYVISQSVAAGEEAPIGSEIKLVISLGNDPANTTDQTDVTIPDFCGHTYEEALQLAEENHILIIANEKAYSASYDADIIMKQDLAAGSVVPSGSTVALTVSLGVKICKVPDVQYQTEAAAIAMIEKNDLKAKVVYEASDTVQAGLVISQDPAPNTQKDPDSEVTIVVSEGSNAFAMPDVIGLSEADAGAKLRSSGLSVNLTYEYGNAQNSGKVLKQSIEAGTSVKQGTQVTLTVSSGAEVLNVANVIGQSKAEAIRQLQAQGFSAAADLTEYSDTVPKGVVMKQSPAANSAQAKGSHVALTVSLGKQPIVLADVVGMQRFLAEATLKNQHLNVIISQTYSSTQAIGVVLSQSPKSGSTVFAGDTISLVVSMGREPVYVNDMTLSRTTKTLNTVGNSRSFFLTATVSPSNADDLSVSYRSSDTSIATVNANGLVTAKKDGDCTITVTANGGSVSRSCVVTVKTAYNTTYGSWSDWSTTAITGSSTLEVGTKQEKTSVAVSYTMGCYLVRKVNDQTRRYRNESANGDYASKGLSSQYGEHHHEGVFSISDVNNATIVPPGGYQGGDFNGINDTGINAYKLYLDGTWLPCFILGTNYQDVTTTYYRSRTITKTPVEYI